MAGKKIRRFFKIFFVVLNSIVAFLFLLACLVPYLNPATWWFMGFLGLMFPYLATLLVFSIFFWWVIKPVLSFIPILTLLIGYKQLSVLFAVKKYETFATRRDSTHIRVVDWNVRSLQGISNKPSKKRIDRRTIPEAITSQNADIICLQEFNTSATQNNIAPFLNRYPYFYFSKDFQRSNGTYYSGSIIFSKYPIVDSGKIKFAGKAGESLIYADVEIQGKILRAYTTHLQSFKFTPYEYDGIEKLKNTEENALPASKSIFQKMKQAFTIRGEQARIVRDALDHSRYPTIICGDFNDVPNSYTYFHIRKDWNDVFLATSLGIGKTYLGIAPTLRIDYILPDNNFFIHQMDMVDEDLSDHLMLVADISFK